MYLMYARKITLESPPLYYTLLTNFANMGLKQGEMVLCTAE